MNMVETELEISPDARFYVDRMTNLFFLRDHLERHPNAYEEVPVRVLREGIHRGIFGSYLMLHTLGQGVLADSMVMFDRMVHNKVA